LTFEGEILILKLIKEKERVLRTERTFREVEMAFEKKQKIYASHQRGTNDFGMPESSAYAALPMYTMRDVR